MAASIVQSSQDGSSAINSATVTLAGGVVGNTAVIQIVATGAPDAISTVVDDGGNTWIIVGNHTVGLVRHALAYAQITTSPDVITVTMAEDQVGMILNAVEVGGVATPNVTGASNTGTGTTATAGTVNPNSTAEAVIASVVATGVSVTENHADYSPSPDDQGFAWSLDVAGSQACTWSLVSAAWGAHSLALEALQQGPVGLAGKRSLQILW